MPPGYNDQSKSKFEWVGKSLLDIDIDDLPVLSAETINDLIVLNNEYKDKNKVSTGSVHKLKKGEGRCNHMSHMVLSDLGVALVHRDYPFNKLVSRLIEKDQEINHDAHCLYFVCPSRPHKHKLAIDNAAEFVEEIFKNHGPDGVYKEKTHSVDDKELKQIAEAEKLGFFIHVPAKKKGDPPKITPSFRLMSKYFHKIKHFKCDDPYTACYDDGHYKYISKNHLDNMILDLSKDQASVKHVAEFGKMIKVRCYYDKDDFIQSPGFINLNNGVLKLETGELLQHNPDYNFTYKLKHDYDKSAKCPQFMKFLDEVFLKDPQLVCLMGEILGYTLLGGDPFKHKAFMFFGEGRNGKSTLLDVITELLGRSNVSAVSMKTLDKPFSTVRLDGKLANIVEESPNNIDSEAFKSITGGGTISAAKKHMDEFDLVVRARLFFACNDFPHFKDNSKGNRERLVIVPFKRFFKESERDTSIKKKLFGEMPGILNFALQGLERFQLFDNQFTHSDVVAEMLEEFIEDTDNVYAWVKERVTVTEDFTDEVSVDELYSSYIDEARSDGYNPCNKNTFLKRVKGCLGNDNFRRNLSGLRARGYCYARLEKKALNNVIQPGFQPWNR